MNKFILFISTFFVTTMLFAESECMEDRLITAAPGNCVLGDCVEDTPPSPVLTSCTPIPESNSIPESNCGEVEKAREISEQEVHNLISNSKSCNEPKDCLLTGLTAPFGCQVIINTEKIGIINEKINKHQKRFSEGDCSVLWMYDCPIASKKEVKCINNKCCINCP